jgi:hypothetical protein
MQWGRPDSHNGPMTAPKIPMNLFAIPFGLAGLGEA